MALCAGQYAARRGESTALGHQRWVYGDARVRGTSSSSCVRVDVRGGGEREGREGIRGEVALEAGGEFLPFRASEVAAKGNVAVDYRDVEGDVVGVVGSTTTSTGSKRAPQIFTPGCVYDGCKNIFSLRKLPFETGSQEFDVTLADATANTSGKGPKVYKIKLTHVAEINPEVLKRFIDGDQSHDNTSPRHLRHCVTSLSFAEVRGYYPDNTVLTAITALNVVIRDPYQQWERF
ncbi:hypothetical protein B0H13DRAFT_2300563 [Mycena leptocephala]|nr:hypothetical protein B0H13DRAFT_2300563 [Mycena leptocephala]